MMFDQSNQVWQKSDIAQCILNCNWAQSETPKLYGNVHW